MAWITHWNQPERDKCCKEHMNFNSCQYIEENRQFCASWRTACLEKGSSGLVSVQHHWPNGPTVLGFLHISGAAIWLGVTASSASSPSIRFDCVARGGASLQEELTITIGRGAVGLLLYVFPTCMEDDPRMFGGVSFARHYHHWWWENPHGFSHHWYRHRWWENQCGSFKPWAARRRERLPFAKSELTQWGKSLCFPVIAKRNGSFLEGFVLSKGKSC